MELVERLVSVQSVAMKEFVASNVHKNRCSVMGVVSPLTRRVSIVELVEKPVERRKLVFLESVPLFVRRFAKVVAQTFNRTTSIAGLVEKPVV